MPVESKTFAGDTNPSELSCPNPHEDVLIDKNIQLNIDRTLNLITRSKNFLKSFSILKLHNLAINCGEWKLNEETGYHQMDITYNARLHLPFLGEQDIEATEYMKLHPSSRKNFLYVIDSDILITRAPIENKTRYTKHICLKKVSENETKMTVVIQSQFLKKFHNAIGSTLKFEDIKRTVLCELDKLQGETQELMQGDLLNSLDFIQTHAEKLIERNVPLVQKTMYRIKLISYIYNFMKLLLLVLFLLFAIYYFVSRCEYFLPRDICHLSILDNIGVLNDE